MISIIAPTYGHMKYRLPIFVNSVLDQSYQDFELLIYHDGGNEEDSVTSKSFRDTRDFLEDCNDQRIIFGWSEERIHLRDGKEDWGHSLRARGIEEASGDYITIHSGDHYLCKPYLELMFNKIESEGLDLVYCNALHNYAGRAFGKPDYSVLDVQPKLNYIDIGCIMVRTEVAREAGFTDRSRGADGIFAERLIALGATHGKLHEALFVHE